MPEHGTLQKDFRKAKYELFICQFQQIESFLKLRGLKQIKEIVNLHFNVLKSDFFSQSPKAQSRIRILIQNFNLVILLI